jgi:uncharacterized LabA/DUF88 family protein
MGRVAIFLDGGYLDKVVYFDHANKRLDFEKLIGEMAKPDDLIRCYYYHCLPYQSNPPAEEERKRFASKQKFFHALSHLSRFQVRLGKLVSRGIDQNGERILVQKRVDTMVGVDMALLAGKGKITRLVLFSGDSDLIPAIEAVKSEGVVVTLWHGSFSLNTSPSQDLYDLCDERVLLSAELVARCLRSTPGVDANP